MAITVKIAPDGTGRIFSHYDPELVALIKELPGSARSWDPETKTWTVHAGIDSLIHSMQSSGYEVLVDDHRTKKSPPPPPAGSDGDWAAQLLTFAGPELAASIHRHLSRALHPDVGGSTELMQQLNRAYDVHVRRRNMRGA